MERQPLERAFEKVGIRFLPGDAIRLRADA
jgi:hypothetical protein